jgi:hypothetical protein
MYRVCRNPVSLFINVWALVLFAVAQAQEPQNGRTSLKCFDEQNPPPKLVGGLDVMMMASATDTMNPHPEKKAWGEVLSQSDSR